MLRTGTRHFRLPGSDVKIVFWSALILTAWCYAGYPLLMLVISRFRPRPHREGGRSALPRVSVVVAVRNGEATLTSRLENLLAASYPADLLEVVVVCNGCTDRTVELVERFGAADPRVRVLVSAAEHGKAGALNRGVEVARGEVVVFADARQKFDVDALRHLVTPFADPEVGAVSGRLIIDRSGDAAVEGVRMYWGLETALRLAESRAGSVVGVTGAIYAIRRERFEPIPANTILDDVWLPMRIAMNGFRVVLAPEAVARDVASASTRHEFLRKRRTMVGNLQLLRLLPGLLNPRENPLFLRFLGHKLLRLASPFLFLTMLLTAALIPSPVYQVIAVLLGGMYVVGTFGLLVPLPFSSLPSSFVMMHAAILSALWHSGADASRMWAASPADSGAVPPTGA